MYWGRSLPIIGVDLRSTLRPAALTQTGRHASTLFMFFFITETIKREKKNAVPKATPVKMEKRAHLLAILFIFFPCQGLFLFWWPSDHVNEKKISRTIQTRLLGENLFGRPAKSDTSHADGRHSVPLIYDDCCRANDIFFFSPPDARVSHLSRA